MKHWILSSALALALAIGVPAAAWQARSATGFVTYIMQNLSASGVPGAVPTNPPLLRFTPDAAERQRDLDKLIADSTATNAFVASYLKTLFSPRDPWKRAGKLMKPLGLRTDDVGDAFTFFILIHWMAARGQTEFPESARTLALRAKVTPILLKSVSDSNFANEFKQEVADHCMVIAVLTSIELEDARGDPVKLAANGERIETEVEAIGLDLKALELGESGLAPTFR